MDGRGEREFTAGLARFFAGPRRLPVGIGDDAAVVEFGAALVAATCDPVVLGVHFEPDADLHAVGRKVVLRNLSDLAAMGACAEYALACVLLPRDGLAADARARLFAGLRDAANEYGCQIIGGDVGAIPGPLTVVVTAFGALAHERPLRRAAARVGDRLHLTGPVGGAGLGRHLTPRARVIEGAWLASPASPVLAAIDVSDGLALDLWTMLQAAGCAGAELDEAALPIHPDAVRAAALDGRSALEHALGDGEDYELLFSVPAGADLPNGGPLDDVARRPIGRIVAVPGLWLVASDGSRRSLALDGYQHDLG